MSYVRGQNHPVFHLAAQPPGVAYVGRIVDEKLRRVVHLSLFPDQTLAVARTYLSHDEFAVIWHFNQQGRIKNIDVEVSGLPARSTRVLSSELRDEAWMTVQASYATIPPETRNINQHFGNLSTGEKYYQLVRYGHILAHKIHMHLENRTMLDTYMRIQGAATVTLSAFEQPCSKNSEYHYGNSPFSRLLSCQR